LHCGFEGAGASHIDDKYGIVDETHRVNDRPTIQAKICLKSPSQICLRRRSITYRVCKNKDYLSIFLPSVLRPK
jgi:hypothetical protein